ncbi:MAG: thioredoxin domain-containing protein [Brasilonema octagenarum HA4186-MV1]|jgi:protein-disulfide isomerase|uniref:Disulfide bond formation protein DsbA n=2 Tax=Brasilonema TaxID=383614 RepID=A0A856MAV6_9CYAN|nr:MULTISPECIES: thioredoxin domain-containing protein [Brasilonema]MBW4624528.1 thioredoxin domain-containing protein [Brasilonema octagenarum HA4186-MV1]NMF63980.1 disulfide bond formation protein DsbA [Brasilonema octagenarum UFV-OR1]QDL07470.1 disulfide bond formation protein DsbA [Brasilonema sennae CENA114]QDL13832.1 disulfide bond formation protein DsbA [Brasilonema octagenarum UFV-E1]
MNDDRSHSSLLVLPSTQDWMEGVLSAKVVLVMYGDYQCPRSADVYKLIKVIKRELSASLGEDYLCFIFRHFPQTQIHPHAQRAAQAAEAAAAQGQFWLMNDTLFTHQQKLENGYLVEYANDLGLDIPQFLKELSKQVHVDHINEDIEGGMQSGVTTAPALFINGIRYTERWNTTVLMAAMIAASR